MCSFAASSAASSADTSTGFFSIAFVSASSASTRRSSFFASFTSALASPPSSASVSSIAFRRPFDGAAVTELRIRLALRVRLAAIELAARPSGPLGLTIGGFSSPCGHAFVIAAISRSSALCPFFL